MKILITGISGFIGSNLADKILKEKLNYEIVGIDRNHCSDELYKEINFIHEDLNELTRLPKDIDVVIHLAARAGVRESRKMYLKYVDDNIIATKHLMEDLKHTDVHRIIYSSSSSIYGGASVFNAGKDNETVVSSNIYDIPMPKSLYAITKLDSEYIIKYYSKILNAIPVIHRLFTVYGERQRIDLAFRNFITNILNDEPITIYKLNNLSMYRDFSYVGDTCNAIIKSIHKGYGIYNIGTGKSYSVDHIVGIMEEIIGKEAKRTYEQSKLDWGEVLVNQAVIDNAIHDLDWRPEIGIREGIRRELEWIKKSS